jgi:hypothetical protein
MIRRPTDQMECNWLDLIFQTTDIHHSPSVIHTIWDKGQSRLPRNPYHRGETFMVLVTYKQNHHSKLKYNSTKPKYCNYQYNITTTTTIMELYRYYFNIIAK